MASFFYFRVSIFSIFRGLQKRSEKEIDWLLELNMNLVRFLSDGLERMQIMTKLTSLKYERRI